MTDGSDAGPMQIIPTPAPTQEIYEFVRSGSWTYFLESSDSDHGVRLWRSDGTSAGTAVVKDLGQPQSRADFVGATERLGYYSFDGKLYRSDRTDGGTGAPPGR